MALKISVIIPIHNSAPFLPLCLDSLTEQKFKDIEYLLIDDGSDDLSPSIMREYAARDGRFKLYTQANRGPSAARNLGLKMANGEYISFVDSDDFLELEAYAKIWDSIEKNGKPDCLIFGATPYPRQAPEHLWHALSPRNVVYEEFRPEMLFLEVGSRPFLWMQVFKAEIIRQHAVKMNEQIRLGEDQLFQIELLPYTKKTVFIAERLYNYRWYRPGSIMHISEKNKFKKQLLHVDLIDRAFTAIEYRHKSDEMLTLALSWSIFFMWEELFAMMEKRENEVAARLTSVWEKHGCQRLESRLNSWGRVRYKHILLMAIQDKNERIAAMRAAISYLEKEVEELKTTHEYKQMQKESARRRTPIGRLRESLKTRGLRGTAKRIVKKAVKAYEV